MEQSESAYLRPQGEQQRRYSVALDKIQRMQDDPNSRKYAFWSGYILFKSKSTTIVVNILACAMAGALVGAIMGTWVNSIAAALGGAIGSAFVIGRMFSRSKKVPIN